MDSREQNDATCPPPMYAPYRFDLVERMTMRRDGMLAPQMEMRAGPLGFRRPAASARRPISIVQNRRGDAGCIEGAESVALVERAGGKGLFVRTDVTREEEIAALVARDPSRLFVILLKSYFRFVFPPILLPWAKCFFRHRFAQSSQSNLLAPVSKPITSGIFHGFEDPVVESFDLFVGITDHKFLLEVFEEVLFGLITSKNQVGVVMRLFKEAFKGG